MNADEKTTKWGTVDADVTSRDKIETIAAICWRWRDWLAGPALFATVAGATKFVTGDTAIAVTAAALTGLGVAASGKVDLSAATDARRAAKTKREIWKATKFPLERATSVVNDYAETLTAHIADGAQPEDLVKERSRIAKVMKAEVFVSSPDPHLVSVRIQRRNILAEPAPWEPIEGVTPDAIPIGRNWDGEIVTLNLLGRSLFVAGVPESGKSTVISGIIARLLSMPATEVYLIDPKKGVDLDVWHPFCEVVTNVEDGIEMMRQFDKARDARLGELVNRGREKAEWPRDTLRVLVVDELRQMTTHADKKTKQDAIKLLADLASLGRASLDVLICATQQPLATIIPTEIRDNFAYVLGMRCGRRVATKVVFGDGFIERGWDLAAIPLSQPGRGLLNVGTDDLIPLRTFGLFGDHRRAVAQELADYKDRSLLSASTPEESGAPFRGWSAPLQQKQRRRVEMALLAAGPKGIHPNELDAGVTPLERMPKRTWFEFAKDYGVSIQEGPKRGRWVHRSYVRRAS